MANVRTLRSRATRSHIYIVFTTWYAGHGTVFLWTDAAHATHYAQAIKDCQRCRGETAYSSMASLVNSQGEGCPLRFLPIPGMLAGWPWQRRINPLYEEVAAEGNAWVWSFSPFNAKSQHAFERCDFALLTSLIFPDALHGRWPFENELCAYPWLTKPQIRPTPYWR